MNRMQLIVQSLVYHVRMHGAVALGVAAATAVLTGALLVGDSVRGSLRRLTFERLGRIDEVVVQDRFFRAELAREIETAPELQGKIAAAVPAILFPQATVEHASDQGTARGSSVLVLGCDERFWSLDATGLRPRQLPGEGEIVLNAVLADELRVRAGDTVTVRLPQSNQVPADSPLASKSGRIRSLTGLKVVDVIPARGLGQFRLQANQRPPSNAFVSLAGLQNALREGARVNTLLLARQPGSVGEAAGSVATAIRPTLDDLGIAVTHIRHGVSASGQLDPVAFEYFTVTTDRMLFSPAAADVIGRVGRSWGAQPLLTYLANTIRRAVPGDPPDAPPGVPYSMVTAIDHSDHFSLVDREGNPIGPLADDELVLNQWAAEDMHIQPGEEVEIGYFEPETSHGQAVERTARFRLKAVATLTRPVRPYRRGRPAEYDRPPTMANDPDLTPAVKGVTDQDTIDDWDAPFPFDYQRVRKVDEEYWDQYRTTPKAFVSYASGVKLWGSRFGQVTSFRFPATGRTLDELRRAIAEEAARHAEELGFQVVPLRARQLAASSGTTPFDLLFLSLSFFVIAAALLMVALLFRLGLELRSAEIGLLLAVGLRRETVRRLFIAEGILVAAVGAAAGVGIGIGYARLLLAGLSHWWLGAITTPFLEFHATGRSLLVGYSLGVVMCGATIAWSLRQMRRYSIRGLLSGQVRDIVYGGASRWQFWLGPACIVTALLLSLAATRLGGMAQAGAFVGSGALLLAGLLCEMRRRMRGDSSGDPDQWTGRRVLWRLAVRNAARNPGRSMITIALMATATFLIVAMSSFRLAPTDAGTGGFRLLAESSQPLYFDLNLPERRQEFLGSRASTLEGATILGLRLRGGDDASCNNLYQAAQPRVLGVSRQFIEHFDRSDAVAFPWAASLARTDAERRNPWRMLLTRQPPEAEPPPAAGLPPPAGTAVAPNPPIAVVVDKNTALYSLHLYGGVGEEFQFTYDDRPLRFRVVGLLENSLLQGSLLISDADFRRAFPDVSGFRYFLVAVAAGQADAVGEVLEDRFSDEGLDVVPARDVLAQLLAVQNTYLSTFQSLGGLGLLLGTLGLATVQLRNVLERRGELALLRAAGYRRRRLAGLVLLENTALLAGGLATGVLAALLAVLPHKFWGESSVSWELLRDLGWMLTAVLVAGLVSSFISVRAVLRMRLLAALRGE